MVNMYGAGKAYNLQFRQHSYFPQRTVGLSQPPHPACFCSAPSITINTTPGGIVGTMMGLSAGFSFGNMLISSIGNFSCGLGNLIGNNKVGNAFVRAGMGMGGGYGMSCPGFGGYGMTYPALGGFGNCFPCFGSMGMSYPSFGGLGMGMGYPALSGGIYSGYGYSPMTMQSTREGQSAADVAQMREDAESLSKLNGLYSGSGYKIVAEGNGKFSATKDGKLVAKDLTYTQAREKLGGLEPEDKETEDVDANGAGAASGTGSSPKPAATKFTNVEVNNITITSTSPGADGNLVVTAKYKYGNNQEIEVKATVNKDATEAEQKDAIKTKLLQTEIPSTQTLTE